MRYEESSCHGFPDTVLGAVGAKCYPRGDDSAGAIEFFSQIESGTSGADHQRPSHAGSAPTRWRQNSRRGESERRGACRRSGKEWKRCEDLLSLRHVDHGKKAHPRHHKCQGACQHDGCFTSVYPGERSPIMGPRNITGPRTRLAGRSITMAEEPSFTTQRSSATPLPMVWWCEPLQSPGPNAVPQLLETTGHKRCGFSLPTRADCTIFPA